LLDVVHRSWPTPLAEAVRRAGSTVIDGLPMLVHQAAHQVELQTGCTPAPLTAMRKAAEAALSEVTHEHRAL
jgi:shikimate dehydrogenase